MIKKPSTNRATNSRMAGAIFVYSFKNSWMAFGRSESQRATGVTIRDGREVSLVPFERCCRPCWIGRSKGNYEDNQRNARVANLHATTKRKVFNNARAIFRTFAYRSIDRL